MDHTKELILSAHNGDKGAREQLVKENMGLVWSIARKFAGMGQEFDDMVQLGSIGLLKCIDRFDVSMDVKFSTYAVPMIIGEIKRFLRDDGMIKISRTLKENQYKAKRAEARLMQVLGREPTVEEIAAESKIAVEDILLAKEAGIEINSIYQTVGNEEDSDTYVIDRLVTGEANCQEDGAPEDMEKTSVINRMALEKVLSGLSGQEQKLIRLRYYEDKTQVETAKQLGMTQVQVSRLEKKVLLGLRKKMV